MSHSNPLCCTNIKYDFSFFNPNLDQKSYFWGWFNFLALVARLFLKYLFFLTKIFGVISGKICGGDNQVFLTLKYFHTNVLVFVKVRLEHSILSWYLIILFKKYLDPHMSGIDVILQASVLYWELHQLFTDRCQRKANIEFSDISFRNRVSREMELDCMSPLQLSGQTRVRLFFLDFNF